MILRTPSLPRRLVSEGIGTAFLLSAIVGSGIMGERLAGGNIAVALLANTLATAAALVALIVTFGPVSGAHFNPVVSVVEALKGALSTRDAVGYAVVQILGALAGAALAHLMFGEPVYSYSTHARAGGAQALSESVATFGLIALIWSCSRRNRAAAPFAVAAYIASAYWFTASTSFANPAVTIARSLSNTFAGIRPVDVPPFIAAQVIGAGAAALVCRWLIPADDQG